MMRERFEGEDLGAAVGQLASGEVELDENTFCMAGVDKRLERRVAHEVGAQRVVDVGCDRHAASATEDPGRT